MIVKFKDVRIEANGSWNGLFSQIILNKLKMVESNIDDGFTPSAENALRFLKNDIGKIKCCILGQDPYPQKGVATGRAFEVGTITSWNDPATNTSLKNILKILHMNKFNLEKPLPIQNVRTDIQQGKFNIYPPNQMFVHWERSGVLLLNTALTVVEGSTAGSNSHSEFWKPFTREVIRFLHKSNSNIKWLLWGKFAQEFASDIPDKNKLVCNHPRLNDYKPGSFFYENHFSKIKNVDWCG